MRIIGLLDRGLARLELSVAVAAMTGLVAILIAQVFFRYILQAPLFFAEELALILMIVASFAGLSLLVASDKLVSVDMLAGLLGARGHAWAAWAMRLTVLVLACLMVAFAVRYLATPWVWIERSATLGVPRATLYAFVGFELAALAFHQAVRVIASRPWARGGAKGGAA